MKIYNRALEKRKQLNSVIENTISDSDDYKTEQSRKVRLQDTRKTQRRPFSNFGNNHGKRKCKSRRGSQKNRSPEIQYQQNNAPEDLCQFRFFDQNCRLSGVRSGIESEEKERLESELSVTNAAYDKKVPAEAA